MFANKSNRTSEVTVIIYIDTELALPKTEVDRRPENFALLFWVCSSRNNACPQNFGGAFVAVLGSHMWHQNCCEISSQIYAIGVKYGLGKLQPAGHSGL